LPVRALGLISGVNLREHLAIKKSEIRYIREIVYGKKSHKNWEITTDLETMPENSPTFVMTNLQGKLKKTFR